MFDRAAELTTQGYPVPLIYGRFLCQAPLVISSAIGTTESLIMPDFAEEEKLVELSGSGGGGKGGGNRKPKEEMTIYSAKPQPVLVAVAKEKLKALRMMPKQSVYLNDTPIEDEQGVVNFDGNVDDCLYRTEQIDQDVLMSGFKDVN